MREARPSVLTLGAAAQQIDTYQGCLVNESVVIEESGHILAVRDKTF